MKNSKDPDIQSFYTSKLQVDTLKKNWSGVKHLEKTERAVKLDEMSFSGQTSRHGIGYVVKEKIPMSKKIAEKCEEMDEQERFAHACQLAMQGQWTKWDHVMKQDWNWQALLYSYSPSLLSFALNSVQLTLPTPDNLQRWNKQSEANCKLCRKQNCTLLHILTGCSKALMEGRYTWRHDSILGIISRYLRAVIVEKNKETPAVAKTTKEKFVNFVRAGQKPKKEGVKKEGMLDLAADWLLYDDLGERKLVFPVYICATTLRPDIIMVSNNTKAIILVELTSPAEENIQQRNSDKRKKYEGLIEQCRLNGWKANLFCVEVGARGFIADSFFGAMKKLGLKNCQTKKMMKEISNIALRCSYSIYIQREREEFVKWKMEV